MEEVHKLVIDSINAALDVVAPVNKIVVKTGSNLYLTRETLEMMKRRDSVRAGTPRFCALRNAANRLVKRDKLASNVETLAKASSDPRVLWKLANDAFGKALTSLPPALVNATGSMTSGKREAAKTINAYFISKVDSLQAASKSTNATSDAVHRQGMHPTPRLMQPTRKRTCPTWQGRPSSPWEERPSNSLSQQRGKSQRLFAA
jgi:hypothetical protein